MRSKVVSGTTLMLLLATMFASAFIVQLARAQLGTIYIRADGSIDPSTAPISTFDNVTYTLTGNVINDSIVVERNNIVCDGSGHTVQGTGAYLSVGIDLSGRTNVTVKSTQIKNFDYGVLLKSSSSNSIIGNNITADNFIGISLNSSYDNSINGNNITNSRYGVYVDYSSSNNSMVGDNITNDSTGVQLDSSSSNTISGNNITANLALGIVLLFSSSNNSIVENNIANSQYGVYLELSSSGNSIVGNSVTNDGTGVWLGSSSDNNSIVGNSMTANIDCISLNSSSGNSIAGNSMTSSGDGIILDYSFNNTVNGNKIAANDIYGIYLGYSFSNSINGNNITANKYYGIYLGYSSNNTVYHNSFENNNAYVYSYGKESENTWDDGYPSGGNYWSNYNLTDANDDGIGDEAYLIYENNTDRYPLMGWFSDFNATSELHVQTLCNSTLSDFNFNGTAITLNVSAENGSTGFCRICIPTALMNGTYRILVNGTLIPYSLLTCSNTTHSYLYFTYHNSTQQVTIIPEFSTWMQLMLTLVTLSASTVTLKRRLLKKRCAA